MNPETLEALKQSIAHWERKVENPDKEPIGPEHCALCQMFLLGEDIRQCRSCPVSETTGRSSCFGTPYDSVVSAEFAFENGDISLDEYRVTCRTELDFLKSLLP